ncbi:MAG: MurT ligase domain-containing protein [Candidatus Curtissbacteria bacterium]|nr:MurT ligase domain-containing protein [Candidatus Curtissbacteria bacterium]
MDFRFLTAVLLGKTVSHLIRFTGGGGTAAPGYYALKIDPNLTQKLAKNLDKNILVSGTNGKTTTSRLISQILSQKHQVVHNRQGSNLIRGIASTLLKNSSIKKQNGIGIWEVDEAALAEAVAQTSPDIIVFLNLFRDQLDRYGEVNSLRTKWQKIVSTLPKSTTLILNADDPGISYLAKFAKCKVAFFGIQDKKINLPEVSNVGDTRYCPNCSQKLIYSIQFSSHIGHYQCSNCGFKRPKPQISASNLKFSPDFSTTVQFTIHYSLFTIHYNLPGLYNVYNVLAACAVSSALQITSAEIKTKIASFSPAFGRFQKIKVKNKNILIFLVKNPTGTNEVLRTLATQKNLNLLTILNDNYADGKDVSWIWDTNWEIVVPSVKNISVSGIRGWDLANRLKYAGFKLNKNSVYKDINYSIEKSLEKLNSNDTLIILPTYTALLSVQKTLNKLGGNLKWHQD